jgi:cyanophycinase
MIRILVCCLAALPLFAAPPYPPEPAAGPLVVVGGGKIPDAVRKEFLELAGGAAKANIVVVSTASADADKQDQDGTFLKPWQDAGAKSVRILHTRDRKVADSAEFVKPLAEATGIWFAGGDQKRIAEAYLGTLAGREFKKRHAAGAVVGGTSAGAAVMSDPMISGGKEAAEAAPGLGFLPGVVIDQHFTQRNRLGRLAGFIGDRPGYPGLGIDEATAIVSKDGRFFRIVGEGNVTLCLAKSPTKPALAEVQSKAFDLFAIRRAAYFRAMKEQFPPAKAAVPEVKNGSLLIVGGGGAGPEIWKRFIDLAGGPEAKIVVVASAMEDPVAPKIGEVLALERFGAKAVTQFHTRDRRKADSDEFTAVLKDAKGVWFSGGRQWRFVDSYEGTLAEKRFREVLDRGGVIGGSSAGASIQSEYMPRGHPLGNTVMAAEGYERGFGYLPGCAVDQHFFARKRTQDMTGLMKQYPQLLGIGIDEGTALVVKGSIAEVIGKSKVGFYDYRTPPKAGETDFVEVKTGESYDLAQRARK